MHEVGARRRRALCTRALPVVCLAAAAAWFAISPSPAGAGPADKGSGDTKTEEPQFAPGKEVKVTDRRAGELGYYNVYLPKGYTPDRAWPVVVCYHGLNGKPTTGPFKGILRGRHFILVGMGYHMRTKKGYDYLATRDVEILKHVLRVLSKQLKIDGKKIFVGGFSKGAFYASGMVNALPELWAGAIILGGGKHTSSARKRAAFRGKPIFIGCGGEDEHLKYAQKANTYYRALGANVIYEVWAGVGHRVDTKSSKVHDWMLAHGPLRGAASHLAAARKDEKAGHLGRAYAMYKHLADLSDTAAPCLAAAKAAAALAERAKQDLSAAQQAARQKRYADAVKLLTQAAAAYKGCAFAEQAEKKLQALRSDPEVRGIIEQAEAKAKADALNARADALEAKAAAAEKKKGYAEAVNLYEQYVARFADADRHKEVAARLEGMRNNKAIQNAIREAAAARDCRQWLRMADNYINAGLPRKAQPYLRRILEKYDGTTWAKQARQRLARIAEGDD